MAKGISEAFFQQVIEKNMYRNRNVQGAVFCVERENHDISWLGAVGNMEQSTPYFITSVTKLCVATLILRLRSEDLLQLDDKINRYLEKEHLIGLHNLNGVDYSGDLSIRHLLGHTSGIPDYLAHKRDNGQTADDALNHGIDEAWPLARVLETVSQMKPKFKPGAKKKVHYSNTNYRLLGTIIERITGGTIGKVFQEYLFDPLNLSHTYAYCDIHDNTPAPMYYKSQELHIPKCMASATAEGGVVSTAAETMSLLKAFFCGRFFPTEYLDDLKVWNFSFLPYQVYFGVGLERLWLPRIVSGFRPISEVLGVFGSVCFLSSGHQSLLHRYGKSIEWLGSRCSIQSHGQHTQGGVVWMGQGVTTGKALKCSLICTISVIPKRWLQHLP